MRCEWFRVLFFMGALGLGAARADDALLLDADTSECEILVALHGGAGAPAECRPQDAPEGAKMAFGPPLPSPRPIRLDNNLLFGFDSTQLTTRSRRVLEKLADALRHPASAGAAFRLEGHSDAQGDANYNLKLSQRRAGVVRHYLIAMGAPGQNLYSVGYGEERPVTSDAYDPANRVVQIVKLSADAE